jgi:hypothetical protein
MTPLQNINVVLIDDNPVTLRHLRDYIAPVTELACGEESLGVTRRPLMQEL